MVKENILTFPVSTGSYQKFIDEIIKLSEQKTSSYVCFANVHMVVEGYNDPLFSRVVRDADIVAPDGQPVALFLRILKGINQVRVAGLDVFPDLLKEAETRNKSVYFYGTTDEILDKIIIRARFDYPQLKICGSYSPPFRNLSSDEESKIIRRINESKPDLVFVALGCPKQENWMAAHQQTVKGCMLGLGHAFNVYAGVSKRSPMWMRRMSLEWAYRLFQEPRRLWKRYFYTNTFFLWLTFKYLLSTLFSPKNKNAAMAYGSDYHLVWVPLNSFRVLTGPIADTLAQYVQSYCRQEGCTVKDVTIQADYIHLNVSIPSRVSVPDLMSSLKRHLTGGLLRSYPSLKKNYNGKFWAKGYLLSTDGMNDKIIKQFVKRQESAGA